MSATEHLACLLLGSNIEPEQNILTAVTLLQERVNILQASSAWESASVDCCYPDFINLALEVLTPLEADQLKDRVLRPLEMRMGRVRTEDKHASRTIDIDIILFDGELLDADLWQHAHQAVPVSELFPDYSSETGESLRVLAAHMAQSTPIHRRQDISVILPEGNS